MDDTLESKLVNFHQDISGRISGLINARNMGLDTPKINMTQMLLISTMNYYYRLKQIQENNQSDEPSYSSGIDETSSIEEFLSDDEEYHIDIDGIHFSDNNDYEISEDMITLKYEHSGELDSEDHSGSDPDGDNYNSRNDYYVDDYYNRHILGLNSHPNDVQATSEDHDIFLIDNDLQGVSNKYVSQLDKQDYDDHASMYMSRYKRMQTDKMDHPFVKKHRLLNNVSWHDDNSDQNDRRMDATSINQNEEINISSKYSSEMFKNSNINVAVGYRNVRDADSRDYDHLHNNTKKTIGDFSPIALITNKPMSEYEEPDFSRKSVKK